MTTFLLIVSFLLHGFLILIIVILSTRVKKAEELEMRQQHVANDIEQMFTAYLLEIKEENERFKRMVESEHGQQFEHNSDSEVEEKGRGNQTMEKKYAVPLKQAEAEPHAEYLPPMPETDRENYQPSLDTQVFGLQAQGYSTEDIARKLNRGKTEIDLILKFKQRNM